MEERQRQLAFNIQVKNEPVAQFVDSFSVGNMKWTTDHIGHLRALSRCLDGDDIFTISSSTSEDVISNGISTKRGYFSGSAD